jgi:hypothetical protein
MEERKRNKPKLQHVKRYQLISEPIRLAGLGRRSFEKGSKEEG